jgi:hypothetical protein
MNNLTIVDDPPNYITSEEECLNMLVKSLHIPDPKVGFYCPPINILTEEYEALSQIKISIKMESDVNSKDNINQVYVEKQGS